MTQTSGSSSPRHRDHHPSDSPAPATSSSSPQPSESGAASSTHQYEPMAASYAGAMGGVLVVDPHMMPPGYVLGQIAQPRVEEQEEPLYVNAKQYHRILKRRAARANLEAENRLLQRGRKYLHESRHKHAMRRPRGPGGRFLTATEIAAMDKEKPDTEVGDLGDVTSGGQGVDGGAFDQSLHHESYQVQHHRQQLKHEELLQQQQLRMQQQQLQQSLPQPRQVYETGL